LKRRYRQNHQLNHKPKSEVSAEETFSSQKEFNQRYPGRESIKLIYLLLPVLIAVCSYTGFVSDNDPTKPFAMLTAALVFVGSVSAVWLSLAIRDEWRTAQVSGETKPVFQQALILRDQYPSDSRSPLGLFYHRNLLIWSLLVAGLTTFLLVYPIACR
jgi:hypothetical protein